MGPLNVLSCPTQSKTFCHIDKIKKIIIKKYCLLKPSMYACCEHVLTLCHFGSKIVATLIFVDILLTISRLIFFNGCPSYGVLLQYYLGTSDCTDNISSFFNALRCSYLFNFFHHNYIFSHWQSQPPHFEYLVLGYL